MTPQPIPTQNHGLDLGDIYYILFRHKWKILFCSTAGILAALAIYKADSPPYQSEAKLLVRYIISDSKTTGPATANGPAKIMPDERGATIMNTESEILGSVDLAQAVVQSIGAEKLLAKAGGGKDTGAATQLIRNNLIINVPLGSSVIHIIFRHPDPELVQPVLKEIIEKYIKLHSETHRSAGMTGDTLQQEADTLRSRLSVTEDELRKALNKAGVVSLENAKEEYANRMVSIRREISEYEAELAGKMAVYEDIKKRKSASSSKTETAAEPEAEAPLAVLEDYKNQTTRLNRLQAFEQELLLQYTLENPRVKENRALLVEAESAVQKLREQYPALTRVKMGSSTGGPDFEASESAAAWIQITAYQAKIKELSSQLEKLRNEIAKLDMVEGTISELRRKKELDDANYRYYAANVEQARISQTIGNGKVSNINAIQSPSPASRGAVSFKKVGISAAAGIIAGLAWAFLIELYLDRSVRRPVDLQRMLRVPLFLSIPRLKIKNKSKMLGAPASTTLAQKALARQNGSPEALAEGLSESAAVGPFHLFHETLRDRLIGYFESKNLTHKPKLVAVTGLSNSSGVTTTAAGLARSLSETGEGNVLLVDMTIGQGAAQQFSKGKEICDLDELLETRTQAHVHENLYVVAESNNSERLSRNLPQRFTKLIPKLKASDFDYIIFDMPTVSQLSITPRLAGFMDMVLLVVESEKNDREVVQGACALLAESKAHVGLVLNKTRNYVPSRLQQQMLSN